MKLKSLMEFLILVFVVITGILLMKSFDFAIRMCIATPIVVFFWFMLGRVFKNSIVNTETGLFGSIDVERWMTFIAAHSVGVTLLLTVALLMQTSDSEVVRSLIIVTTKGQISVVLNAVSTLALFILLVVSVPIVLYVPWKLSVISALRPVTTYLDNIRVLLAALAANGILGLAVISATLGISLF